MMEHCVYFIGKTCLDMGKARGTPKLGGWDKHRSAQTPGFFGTPAALAIAPGELERLPGEVQGQKHFILEEIPPITPLFIRISEDVDALTALAETIRKKTVHHGRYPRQESVLMYHQQDVCDGLILLSPTIYLDSKYFGDCSMDIQYHNYTTLNVIAAIQNCEGEMFYNQATTCFVYQEFHEILTTGTNYGFRFLPKC